MNEQNEVLVFERKTVTSGGRICDAIFVAYTDVNEYLGYTRRPDDDDDEVRSGCGRAWSMLVHPRG